MKLILDILICAVAPDFGSLRFMGRLGSGGRRGLFRVRGCRGSFRVQGWG